jgi:hypothetical protein
MTNPKRDEDDRPDTTTARRRLEWMAANLFDGRPSRLAAAIGVSSAAISRVFSKKQEPGPRLLAAAAAEPRINPEWVKYGVGEPLRRQEDRLQVASWDLPVVNQILPSRPSQCPLRTIQTRFGVAPAHFGPERYWLEFATSLVLGPQPPEQYTEGTPGIPPRLADGDRVLMEGDPAAWLNDLAILRSRLCAVQFGFAGKVHAFLLRGGTPVFKWHFNKKIAIDIDFTMAGWPTPENQVARREGERNVRGMIPLLGEKEAGEVAAAEPLITIRPDNVTAVYILHFCTYA